MIIFSYFNIAYEKINNENKYDDVVRIEKACLKISELSFLTILSYWFLFSVCEKEGE